MFKSQKMPLFEVIISNKLLNSVLTLIEILLISTIILVTLKLKQPERLQTRIVVNNASLFPKYVSIRNRIYTFY